MPSPWLYVALPAFASSPSLDVITTFPFMSRLVWFSPTLASSPVAMNVLPWRTDVTFDVDEPRAAVGIGVLLLGLDANRLALALDLHEECAGAFDGRRRVAAFDRRGRRRLFAPACREKDDRDHADGDGQHEQARALLPEHDQSAFDGLSASRARRRTSLTDSSRYSLP